MKLSGNKKEKSDVGCYFFVALYSHSSKTIPLIKKKHKL
ncbi:hypothetical protein BOVA604_2038 [Bacteroides ovatus]|nr:hypothetical protein BOVA604_2038 [Bacteroides ovatus]